MAREIASDVAILGAFTIKSTSVGVPKSSAKLTPEPATGGTGVTGPPFIDMGEYRLTKGHHVYAKKLLRGMRTMIPKKVFPSRPPTELGLTWHHNSYEIGILELIPRSHHTSAGIVQQNLHPKKKGGIEIWGGGRSNKKGKIDNSNVE